MTLIHIYKSVKTGELRALDWSESWFDPKTKTTFGAYSRSFAGGLPPNPHCPCGGALDFDYWCSIPYQEYYKLRWAYIDKMLKSSGLI